MQANSREQDDIYKCIRELAEKREKVALSRLESMHCAVDQFMHGRRVAMRERFVSAVLAHRERAKRISLAAALGWSCSSRSPQRALLKMSSSYRGY